MFPFPISAFDLPIHPATHLPSHAAVQQRGGIQSSSGYSLAPNESSRSSEVQGPGFAPHGELAGFVRHGPGPGRSVAPQWFADPGASSAGPSQRMGNVSRSRVPIVARPQEPDPLLPSNLTLLSITKTSLERLQYMAFGEISDTQLIAHAALVKLQFEEFVAIPGLVGGRQCFAAGVSLPGRGRGSVMLACARDPAERRVGKRSFMYVSSRCLVEMPSNISYTELQTQHALGVALSGARGSSVSEQDDRILHSFLLGYSDDGQQCGFLTSFLPVWSPEKLILWNSSAEELVTLPLQPASIHDQTGGA